MDFFVSSILIRENLDKYDRMRNTMRVWEYKLFLLPSLVFYLTRNPAVLYQ